ncbi:protein suppressor of white apricot-like [Anopheles nili]|uniref:protein suppressor of white apricot-like n=1 Tax=Anopheles nili TaxID=185578 RepID=UPI00237A0D6B|nr:protein suppressor of white apricot-like [Anopheles nili]
MTERWNFNNSALRSGLNNGMATSASNTGTNGAGIGCVLLGTGSLGDGIVKGEGNAGAGTGTHMGGASGTTFNVANGESGILRRTGHYHQHSGAAETFDDLLVFGYSCKIFRNDERARFIDQGQHLIPWMGDNQLKIDRYDARGALHDLSPYEAPPGGYKDRLEGLTAAEQKAEQLCEEERYYSLYNNEVEEEMYQEEVRKREKMLGNQVPFNYDAPLPQEGVTVATVEDRTAVSNDDLDDDPYVIPEGFDVPSDIVLPETMKEHAIIEKTAKFIASQDSQMEILLKTKQANNPLFDFLNQNGRLFRYYRHMLLAFRTNQYPALSEQPMEEQNATVPDGVGTTENEQAILTRPTIFVPAIKYKPSVDCAYTQLISKITGAPIPTISLDVTDNAGETSTGTLRLTALNTEVEYYPDATVTSVEVKKVSTGLAGLVQYDSDSENDDENESQKNVPNNEDVAKTSKEFPPFQGLVPALAIQHVIDRTATYVAKNGYSFEEALRVKNDPRFVFLNQTHEFYPYYAYRVRHRMNSGDDEVGLPLRQNPPSPPPTKVRTENENGTVVETTPSLGIKAVHTAAPKTIPVPVTNIQHQKLGAPVSFSLVRKVKDETGPVKTMPGLGSDEEDEISQICTDDELKRQHDSESGATVQNGSDSKEYAQKESINTPPSSSKEDIVNDLVVGGTDVLEASPPRSLSRTPATSPCIEKEPAATKEKQAERKKRVNMFVNLIKHVDRKPDVPQEASLNGGMIAKKVVTDETVPRELTVSDDDEGSIHSIRSTSLSPKEQNSLPSEITTTVIEDDDDDDDVVLVSESRPMPVPSRSCSRGEAVLDTERSNNGSSSRSKKKKSKNHRSVRGKKKSKKKSRSHSSSRSRADRSCSPRSRERKRNRSGRSRSRSNSNKESSSSTICDNSTLRSRVKHAKRSERANRSRSVSRSQSRSHLKSKHSRKRSSSAQRKRKERSRSRSARRKSDSDTENRHRRSHRTRPEVRSDRHYDYDERYPPTRARYWDC